MVTYEELLQEAITIKNNRLPSSNTATLVGGLLVHIVEYLSKDGKYWANLPVQNMAREDTEPVFAKIKIGDGTIAWDDENNCLVFNKGVVSESFISAFGVSQGGSEEVSGVSSIKYNSQTFRAVDGVIDISSIAISGGVSSWIDLTDKPSWIGASKPSYAFSEITGSVGFSQLPTMYWANVAISNTSNEQTEPTFKSIKIGGGKISWNADGYFEFDNGVVSQSFISAFGVSESGSGEVVGASSIKYNSQIFNSVDGVIDISQINISGGVSSWNDLTDKPSWIGASKPSYAFSEITSKPTTISGYGITDAITTANIGIQSVLYAHGTRDKDHHSTNTRYTTANNNFADGALHYYLATSSMTSGKPTQGDSQIIHCSWDNSAWESQIAIKDGSKGLQTRHLGNNGWSDWHTLAYIDDNVASATKLQTARTLWGKSFDGSANVSGQMTDVGHIYSVQHKTYDIGSNTNSWRYGYFKWLGSSGSESFGLGANNSTHMAFTTSGNVGIGTILPSSKLHIYQTEWDNGLTLQRSVAGGGTSIKCLDGNGALLGVFGINGSKEFEINNNNTNNVRVLANGNVGIGTTSPSAKLDVNGNAKATKFIGALEGNADTATELKNYNKSYTLPNTSGTRWIRIAEFTSYLAICEVIITNGYYSTAPELLKITAGPSYSANSTYNPYFHLKAEGASVHHKAVRFVWDNTNHKGFLELQTAQYSNTLIIRATQLRDCTLYGAYTSGDSIPSGYVEGKKISLVGGMSIAGNILATSEITSYSDKRLKNDIKDLDFRGALMPKSFIKDGKQSIGFIAQEVRELYPELVLGEETEDSYLSLNYGAITAVLACQTNDHERRIAELERENRELKKKLNI